MVTQRKLPRIAKRKAPESNSELVRARVAIEHELCELSDYLEGLSADRVTRGEWCETWAE